MRNGDKSKLEERVIAYFDGSLDSEGSRSLLREVAESPGKRALFKAHETLARLIVAARAPMEAPLEVRRSIAERIPGMLAFIPGLLGTAETVPVLTENANPFIAFFARMSLTTAVSIGSAVAVLVTGILLKNNFEDHSARPSSPKIAVVQNPAMKNLTKQSDLLTYSSNRTYGADRMDRVYSLPGTVHAGTLSAPASISQDNGGNRWTLQVWLSLCLPCRFFRRLRIFPSKVTSLYCHFRLWRTRELRFGRMLRLASALLRSTALAQPDPRL